MQFECDSFHNASIHTSVFKSLVVRGPVSLRLRRGPYKLTGLEGVQLHLFIPGLPPGPLLVLSDPTQLSASLLLHLVY